jgi:hypothetical protein
MEGKQAEEGWSVVIRVAFGNSVAIFAVCFNGSKHLHFGKSLK